MKKNNMMRKAAGLTIVTLLTTSVIAGVFAKYTTQGAASDNARVAKWGVTLSSEGMLYSEGYKDFANGNKGTSELNDIIVQTNNYNNTESAVVAPGTENPDNGLKIVVDGQPEVTVAMTGSLKANTTTLPAGTYHVAKYNNDNAGGKPTDENYTTTEQTITQAYYPVKYTLKKDDEDLECSDKNLIEICQKLDGLYGVDNTHLPTISAFEYEYSDNATTTKDYAVNTDLGAQIKSTTTNNGVYTLTWKWEFDDSENAVTNDVLDTFLGNIIAEATGEAGNTIDESKEVCYVDAAKDNFYTVDAYDTLDDETKNGLSEVTYPQYPGLPLSDNRKQR